LLTLNLSKLLPVFLLPEHFLNISIRH